jgi:hypothetical protein
MNQAILPVITPARDRKQTAWLIDHNEVCIDMQ